MSLNENGKELARMLEMDEDEVEAILEKQEYQRRNADDRLLQGEKP